MVVLMYSEPDPLYRIFVSDLGIAVLRNGHGSPYVKYARVFVQSSDNAKIVAVKKSLFTVVFGVRAVRFKIRTLESSTLKLSPSSLNLV